MQPFHIVVCGSIVPDPLQTLEPVAGPALKNEMMLPAVLDPWAGHALYEAAHLAKQVPGQQGLAGQPRPEGQAPAGDDDAWPRRSPFELVALDGPAGGFTDSFEVAAALAEAIQGIAGLDRARLLVFGGWESASRGAGATMQMVGERLGIVDQFQGVDELTRCRRRLAAGSGARRWRRAPAVGLRRSSGACWAGPRATCRSRPTTRRSAWPTCGPSCPRCSEPSPSRSDAEGLSFASVKVPSQWRDDEDRQGSLSR